MIVNPFYRKILVKDYDLPDSWTDELIVTLKYLELDKDRNCSFTQQLKDEKESMHFVNDKHKITKPYIIHEKTAKEHNIITELRKIFIDGFCELNEEYENLYTEEYLRQVYLNDSGNFAVLKPGSYVGSHNHPSIAFAIFYLTDVDNDKDGGELILHDPSFNTNIHFAPPKIVKIPTKKNRLVIGPSNMWHEVEPYNGSTNRMCAVIDLKR